MQQTSGPKALTEYILKASREKAEKSALKLIVQGILAGIYISLGAIAYFKVAAATADPGLGAFLGAFVFPFGLIAIIQMHAELFTSDCLVMTAIYARRTKLYKILRILMIILITNTIGTIFIAVITNASGIFNEQAMAMVIEKSIAKVNMPFGKLFVSAVLCNIVVSTGVCMAYSCKEEIAKIVVLWLMVIVFVLTGTEHVVANAYYLFTAYFAGADITLGGMIYNLSVSAIGNFIGGGIIVAGANAILAYKDIRE